VSNRETVSDRSVVGVAMRLGRSIVVGALVGTLGLFGCTSDDGGGGGGTAGSGGTAGGGGAGLGCNQIECLADPEAAAKCMALVAACIENEAPEEQCVIGGLCLFCFDCGGAGGSGGTGGTGGSAGNGGAGGSAGAGGTGGSAGTGGTGGTDGPFCDEGLCVAPSVADECRRAAALCSASGEPAGDCIAAANLIFCNEFSHSTCNEQICQCTTLNTPCTFSCLEGDCNQECEGDGVVCTAECVGARCNQECDRGAICELNCAGGNCIQECEEDALRCDTTCTGGRCDSPD
jgi:hypothetical protein